MVREPARGPRVSQVSIKIANTVLNVPRALIPYFTNQFLRLTDAMREQERTAGDLEEKPGRLKNDVSLG